MRSGELRHRVTIERLTASLGPWGRQSSWLEIATCHASVRAAGGDEPFRDAGVMTDVKWTVRMRYRSDLTTEDRLRFGGKVLSIVSVVDVDGRRRELELTCREHGNGDGEC